MNVEEVKKQSHPWRFTSYSLLLLLAVALIFIFWSAKNEIIQWSEQISSYPWIWWRGVSYCVLYVLWPMIMKSLTKQHQHHNLLTRKPLLLLIIFYEVVIVQNILSLMFNWFR